MNLIKTNALLQTKSKEHEADSYAVLVSVRGKSCLLTSRDVNQDTYFDMASMGKVFVTSTLILKAVDKNKIGLEDTLDQFFEHVPEEKAKITIRQLLTHTSGIVRILIPERVADAGKSVIAEYILANPLAFAPGTDCQYSCNGYILLGFILEKIYGLSLDEIYYKYLSGSLGLIRSRFNIPFDEENAVDCFRWKYPGKLRVDDENIYALGGIAGNGGFFSCISDIQKFINAVMAKSELLYAEKWYDLAEKNATPCFEEGRGLGYLVVNPNYKQTGQLFPVGSFGHCGHTGQSFFINREKDLYVIILTNAIRSLNKRTGFSGYSYETVKRMREEIHNAIYEDLKDQNLI